MIARQIGCGRRGIILLCHHATARGQRGACAKAAEFAQAAFQELEPRGAPCAVLQELEPSGAPCAVLQELELGGAPWARTAPPPAAISKAPAIAALANVLSIRAMSHSSFDQWVCDKYPIMPGHGVTDFTPATELAADALAGPAPLRRTAFGPM
jgi:hypothetical protein